MCPSEQPRALNLLLREPCSPLLPSTETVGSTLLTVPSNQGWVSVGDQSPQEEGPAQGNPHLRGNADRILGLGLSLDPAL